MHLSNALSIQLYICQICQRFFWGGVHNKQQFNPHLILAQPCITHLPASLWFTALESTWAQDCNVL